MPLSGVANLPDAQRRSTKTSTTTPHHDFHGSSKSKSKSSKVTPPAVPFIQQMQLLQVLEGGKLEDHIRRHHQHFGEGALEEARDRNFKDDRNGSFKNPGGYAITDERGMMWFDEEEEWEFKELLPKEDEASAPAVSVAAAKPTGLRKLFGASKKPGYVITGWETFDQSGRVDDERGIETDDDNGGISPGVTSKLGFAYPPEYNTVIDKKIRRTATSFQCGYVPPNGALKLPPPPPPSNNSRRKQPIITHNVPNEIPYSSSIPSKTALTTMSHNRLKKEFLAQAFTPSVSLPGTRSHTPTSNSQISLLPVSRSQTSLAIPSSNSSRSVSPFAKLRSRKASISGAKSNF